MTEQGVVLAEFLQQLMKPEREEFSSYIFNVYNILQKTRTSGNRDPYVNGLRARSTGTRSCSPSALKRLATFIKKIIERMVREEETMESLTENVLEYCEGDFIQRVRASDEAAEHSYVPFLHPAARLEAMQNRCRRCLRAWWRKAAAWRKNRSLEHIEAANKVLDMLQTIPPVLLRRLRRDHAGYQAQDHGLPYSWRSDGRDFYPEPGAATCAGMWSRRSA